MRSIIILCTALLFIVLSAVLSLAVYDQYGAVNLQHSAVKQSVASASEKIKDDNIVDGISASFLSTDNSSEFDSSISPNVYSWITEFSRGRNFSRRTFEPVSIFLFGAGLIGVAIFSRRKLNNKN